MGAKNLFVCVRVCFRVIPYGGKKHINKPNPPPKEILGQSREKLVYVFFFLCFFAPKKAKAKENLWDLASFHKCILLLWLARAQHVHYESTCGEKSGGVYLSSKRTDLLSFPCGWYTLARKDYIHKFMFSELISRKITFQLQ